MSHHFNVEHIDRMVKRDGEIITGKKIRKTFNMIRFFDQLRLLFKYVVPSPTPAWPPSLLEKSAKL